jgi:hypothetical protein
LELYSNANKIMQFLSGYAEFSRGMVIKRTGTATSYSTATTDIYIGVTSTAAARTITMFNSGRVTGMVFIIKDESGGAGTNNITIDGNGANIDGESSVVINKNYGCVAIYWNSTSWSVLWHDSGVQSVHAAGTAYSLTATPAKLDFGTTDPSFTLVNAGTYLLQARVRLDYNAATFAAVRTATLKLRRTNNTAADLTNGSVAAATQIVTTLSGTFIVRSWPVIYSTANNDDTIEIFGSLDVVPSAGSLDAVEASIIVTKL